MNVTKNELATMTESFDITTTKARLAESGIAFSIGIARLRNIATGDADLNPIKMEAILDMLQTETKRIEMYSKALGEMNAR